MNLSSNIGMHIRRKPIIGQLQHINKNVLENKKKISNVAQKVISRASIARRIFTESKNEMTCNPIKNLLNGPNLEIFKNILIKVGVPYPEVPNLMDNPDLLEALDFSKFTVGLNLFEINFLKKNLNLSKNNQKIFENFIKNLLDKELSKRSNTMSGSNFAKNPLLRSNTMGGSNFTKKPLLRSNTMRGSNFTKKPLQRKLSTVNNKQTNNGNRPPNKPKSFIARVKEAAAKYNVDV